MSVIRGGQASIHYVRMSKQVINWALGIALLTALAYLAVRVWFWTEPYEWYLVYKYLHADTVMSFSRKPESDYILYMPNGDMKIMALATFLYDPAIVAHYLQMKAQTIAWGLQALIPGAIAAAITTAAFIWVGIGLSRSDRIRGSRLVTAPELQAIIERKWRAWRKTRGKTKSDEYRYAIGGIDFPPDAPMVHTQMIGTTGAGKSVAMMELLDQIRAQGDKAVIYDRMGSFTRFYYDEETDFILNPFDVRDAGWSPFADADSGPGFAAMAEAMIPAPKNVSDPFWSDAARSVFRSLAEALSQGGNANVEDLSRIILKSDLATLADSLRNTPGGAMMDLASPKTAQSVRSSVVQPLEFLTYLKHRKNAFSIGDWVRKEGPGFLFLSGQVEHAAATRNLISAAIEIAANATMTCGPSERPRIWFFIDELPSLNYLPCLDRSLAEIRQFGGCFVIGYQVFAKLEDVYGIKVAEAISGTVNNSVIFDTPDEPTAKRCSLALGMEDITEKSEGMSIGANETRDGVTFQHKRIERAIATPSEIMDLPPLTAYLRYAYDTPRAKIELTYKHRAKVAEAFKPPTAEAVAAEAIRRAAEDAETVEANGGGGRGADVPADHQEVGTAKGNDRRTAPSAAHDMEDARFIDMPPLEPPAAPRPALLPVPGPAALDPEQTRRGEERFMAEAETWLKGIEGPPSFKTGKPDRCIKGLERTLLRDHFLIARLRGIAASEIGEIRPDETPTDRKERDAFNRRNEEDARLLKAFIKRETARDEQRATQQREREVARKRFMAQRANGTASEMPETEAEVVSEADRPGPPAEAPGPTASAVVRTARSFTHRLSTRRS